MKKNKRSKNEGKSRTWSFDCFRSCILVAAYSAVLIVIVFLAEILQGNGKGMESVYAMSQKRDDVQRTWEELDGERAGGGDWWIGSIQANLENVLRNSMQKYMEPVPVAGYGNDTNEGLALEQQGLLGSIVEVGSQEGQDPPNTGPVEQSIDESQPVGQEILPNALQSSELELQETETQTNGQDPQNQPIEPDPIPQEEPNSESNDQPTDQSKQSKKKKQTKKSDKRKKNVVPKRIALSKEDKNVLLRIVEAEATGESIKGKMLVANVVLNRVNSKRFPNTVKKVVFQNNGKNHQFSPISDGRYWTVKISKETKTAVERVLNGEDNSGGALYFMCRKYAKPRNVRWFDNNLKWLYKYGTHEFYK